MRRLAFQALFQLDATGGDEQAAQDWLQSEGETTRAATKAMKLALEAWGVHDEADALMTELSPTWPASRQPAVDRAILRLAYAELVAGKPAVGVVISEAVELAKTFGGERSPKFINALLDSAAKRLAGATTVVRDGEPTA